MDLNLGQFMSDAFDVMYKNGNIGQAADCILKLIGRVFKADAAYIAETSDSGDLIERVYEWKNCTEFSLKEELEERNSKLLYCREDFCCIGSDEFPMGLTAIFKEKGIRSAVQCPIWDNGQPGGYLGVCSCIQPECSYQRDEIYTALVYISRLLSVFMQKSKQEERMGQNQRQLEGSLKQSEQKADTAYEILDAISSGVVILKMPSYDKLIPVYGNIGQYRMLRIKRTAQDARVPDTSEAELESQYFDDAFAGVHPDDMERVRKEYKAGYETEHFVVKKYRLLRGDGSYVWVNADLRLQESAPDYKLFYATYTDVTEEHELQEQLSKALEKQKIISSELEQASNAKTDFLSRMSHDIRTPMNAILGLASLARNELDHSGKVRSYLDKLEASGQFLLGLLNDVLDISKIERNVIELNPEPYGIDEFQQQVESLIIPQCRRKDIQFNFYKEEIRYSTILMDKLRMNQIILNLLKNSGKYTPGGGRIELHVRDLEENNGRIHIQLLIKDNGIGMSKEFQEHMYEPFSQERRENAGGDIRNSGLGLAIVRSLVELMDGKIQVNSEVGQGTVFTVDLWPEICEMNKDCADQDKKQDFDIKDVRILLCEDNKLNTEIAVYLLENAGAVVECAENGQEAVRKFTDSCPGTYQVILMDIRMPIMDGLEAARRIRALNRPDSERIPIFAMTANAYKEDREMSRNAGMNEHLAKPIEPELLFSAIREYTKRGRDGRQSG